MSLSQSISLCDKALPSGVICLVVALIGADDLVPSHLLFWGVRIILKNLTVSPYRATEEGREEALWLVYWRIASHPEA